MPDFQTAESKYAFYITPFFPEFGRSLLVVASEYGLEEAWITETHVCLPLGHGASPDSTIKRTAYARGMEDFLPTIEDEIRNSVAFGQGKIDTAMLAKGRKYFHHVYFPLRDLDGPLPSGRVEQLRVFGEFPSTLQKIRHRTRCDSLKAFLDHLDSLPRLESEQLPDEEP